jgi:methylenetetrahydrofolate dehydrogenase (NADP+)/methenyltetrahydrofolate cyclohydrolase
MEKILDGKKLAEKLNNLLKNEIRELVEKTRKTPKLAVVLIGDDPASEVYIRNKRRICSEIGIKFQLITLPSDIPKEILIKNIEKLNQDNNIHGILVQMPIPLHLKPFIPEFVKIIDPMKDVDGFHPINKGNLFDYKENLIPCTPQGIIALLEHYNIEIKGKDIVIINRSNLVGKPLIFMLLKRNGTVTICHTSTKNIEDHMRRAEILVSAVGRPNFVTKEKIKRGVILIDVGINRVDGKLCGDIDFNDVYDKCGAITPSPGGIGPLTVSFLMRNTVLAFKNTLLTD